MSKKNKKFCDLRIKLYELPDGESCRSEVSVDFTGSVAEEAIVLRAVFDALGMDFEEALDVTVVALQLLKDKEATHDDD